MIEAHDHAVYEHNADDEAVEPGINDDAPSQLSVPLELIPGDQILPLQEHGGDEFEIEFDVGSHIGLCSVTSKYSFLIVYLQTA